MKTKAFRNSHGAVTIASFFVLKTLLFLSGRDVRLRPTQRAISL
jgi:hypothetical protein